VPAGTAGRTEAAGEPEAAATVVGEDAAAAAAGDKDGRAVAVDIIWVGFATATGGVTAEDGLVTALVGVDAALLSAELTTSNGCVLEEELAPPPGAFTVGSGLPGVISFVFVYSNFASSCDGVEGFARSASARDERDVVFGFEREGEAAVAPEGCADVVPAARVEVVRAAGAVAGRDATAAAMAEAIVTGPDPGAAVPAAILCFNITSGLNPCTFASCLTSALIRSMLAIIGSSFDVNNGAPLVLICVDTTLDTNREVDFECTDNASHFATLAA
jgi:hypothetical protein